MIAVAATTALALGYLLVRIDGFSPMDNGVIPRAEAAGGTVADPRGTAPDRYTYYPGTENLS